MKYNLKLGCHVGLSKVNSQNKKSYLFGSLQQALDYNANSFMVYTGAPQSTKRVPMSNFEVEKFKKYAREVGFNIKNIIVHAPYIVNLCNPDPKKREFSRSFLIAELKRIHEMGSDIMVLHPGNHLTNTIDEGISICANEINKILSQFSKVRIAFETMAGKGTEICHTFEQMNKLLNSINPKYQDLVGVCLDSCHLNDAGYDVKNNFKNVLNQFDKVIGLEKVLACHVNDSKNVRGSRKDRHENLDMGTIGSKSIGEYIFHPKLNGVIKVLETPWKGGVPIYKEEITLLKKYLPKSWVIE